MHEMLGDSRERDSSCRMKSVLTYYVYISNNLNKDAILMLPTTWQLLVRGFFSRPSMSCKRKFSRSYREETNSFN